MKNCLAGLFLVAVMVMTGCNDSPPGGPGATDENRDRTAFTPEFTFRLDVPNLEATLLQGEKKDVTIGIRRGTNFDQDVRLEFKELPQGLKAIPAKAVLGKGDKDVQVTLEAAADAALGHHTFNVVAIPQSGEQALALMKVEIKKP